MERDKRGRLKVTGPDGQITLQEPGGDTRRDLRRDSAVVKIEAATGLRLG